MDEQTYRRRFEWIEGHKLSIAENLDKTILYIGGGIFVFTINLVTFFNSPLQDIWLLIWAWALSAASLIFLASTSILVIFSSDYALKYMNKHKKEPENDNPTVVVFNWWLFWLNALAFMCVVSGAIMLIVFASINLDSKNMREIEQLQMQADQNRIVQPVPSH